VLFLASRSEDEMVINILNDHLPEYGNSNNTIFGIDGIHKSTVSISVLLMIVMNIPLYFVILLLRSKIMQCLKETGDFLSDRTRKMHSQFATMLTQQCIIPPVVFVASLVPIQLEYLNLVRHPVLETMINIFACLSTILSPLIVMYHIIPYRRLQFSYEAVCVKIEQFRMGLAQVKSVNSLKHCYSGFLRVLMTMDTFTLLIVPPLAPDDVASKSVFLEYLCTHYSKFYETLASGVELDGGDALNLTLLPLVYVLPRIDRTLLPEGGERAGETERAQRQRRDQGRETRRYSKKTDIDATSSGANGGTTSKVNASIVISTLKKPE
ncbi:hypothetical protein PRIPAC_95285, partial [Pristionchus pacificus]|uniref:G protein-coupled receptor n=1 Tax=Pristionchus pacificus TaxID=54126 RepID=A0A2A6D189_PRIPA